MISLPACKDLQTVAAEPRDSLFLEIILRALSLLNDMKDDLTDLHNRGEPLRAVILARRFVRSARRFPAGRLR